MLSLLDRRTLSPAGLSEAGPAAQRACDARRAEALSVSLAIPTQRRPEGLATAVRSIFRQTGVDLAEAGAGDRRQRPGPLGRGRWSRQLAAEAPFPVRYVHEPAAGVANARNAALAAARGDLIAFLDDDEEAAPGWLAALIDDAAPLRRRRGVRPGAGPGAGRASRATATTCEQFFSREGPAETGDHRPLLRLRRQPGPPRRAAASDPRRSRPCATRSAARTTTCSASCSGPAPGSPGRTRRWSGKTRSRSA